GLLGGLGGAQELPVAQIAIDERGVGHSAALAEERQHGLALLAGGAGGVARLVSRHPQPFVRINQRQRRAVLRGVLVVAVGVGQLFLELLSRAEEAASPQAKPLISEEGNEVARG